MRWLKKLFQKVPRPQIWVLPVTEKFISKISDCYFQPQFPEFIKITNLGLFQQTEIFLSPAQKRHRLPNSDLTVTDNLHLSVVQLYGSVLTATRWLSAFLLTFCLPNLSFSLPGLLFWLPGCPSFCPKPAEQVHGFPEAPRVCQLTAQGPNGSANSCYSRLLQPIALMGCLAGCPKVNGERAEP